MIRDEARRAAMAKSLERWVNPGRKRKTYNHPEGDIQKTIIEYLTIKRIFFWRQNTGAFRDSRTGALYRYGKLGSPDIFAVIGGRLYGFEVKSPQGRVSDAQQRFGRELIGAGGVWAVVRSVEEVEEIINNNSIKQSNV